MLTAMLAWEGPLATSGLGATAGAAIASQGSVRAPRITPSFSPLVVATVGPAGTSAAALCGELEADMERGATTMAAISMVRARARALSPPLLLRNPKKFNLREDVTPPRTTNLNYSLSRFIILF